MLSCHLTHVPNTYLIEAESVRAQSYSSGLQAYSSPLRFAVRQLRSEGYGHPGLGNNPSTCQPNQEPQFILPHPRYLCYTCDTGQLTLSQEESSRGFRNPLKTSQLTQGHGRRPCEVTRLVQVWLIDSIQLLDSYISYMCVFCLLFGASRKVQRNGFHQKFSQPFRFQASQQPLP